MNKGPWQRLYNYEKGLVVFFGVNLVFTLVNEKVNLIPFEISGYFFWLSLGLYLGFRLVRWEVVRVQKKQATAGRKDENIFSEN
ncbi:MAG: hypothetical protein IT237_07090 [Bacteroidia bacterium]|nr:hypothetical protein [Bacteroidia bacterium]